jgi:hypothetical protein
MAPGRPRGAEEDNTGGLPPVIQADIRAAAHELVLAWRAGKPPAAPPPPGRLVEMLEIALGPGNRLPPSIGPLLSEELAGAGRDVDIPRPPAAVVISATGYLNRPAYPDIPGLADFAGPCMHTARWRSDVDVAGRRVAILGTGANAMQLVPAIAGVAGGSSSSSVRRSGGSPTPTSPARSARRRRC